MNNNDRKKRSQPTRDTQETHPANNPYQAGNVRWCLLLVVSAGILLINSHLFSSWLAFVIFLNKGKQSDKQVQ